MVAGCGSSREGRREKHPIDKPITRVSLCLDLHTSLPSLWVSCISSLPDHLRGPSRKPRRGGRWGEESFELKNLLLSEEGFSSSSCFSKRTNIFR